MKTNLFVACGLLFLSAGIYAQVPEDALRYGYPLSGGTARSQAIGGAMTSLGGDISAAHINPAGIGLYKNKEFVLSPNFNFINNKYDYRGEATKSSQQQLSYGTSGFVFGSMHDRGRKTVSSAFAISINQLANYNNKTSYTGINNTSSWSEQYVEELTRNRATIPQAENNYIFGSSLAFWTYLVDTIANASGEVIGYQSLVPVRGNNAGVRQTNMVETSGGAHELALSFGNNYQDKLHLGFSFNVPFYNFEKSQVYTEEDISGNNNNDFSNFEYRENYSTNGVGVNFKLGMIYRPADRWRLGLAFHSPTFAGMTDKISSSITTNTENYTIYPQPASKTSDELKNGNENAGNYEYSLITPLRALGSVSFVINEVKDITRQKGFITADLEFVNYGGVRYSATSEDNPDDEAYYNALNEVIKDRYKGALNARIGGELKFKTIMTRAGFAYFGSPYESSELKGSRMQLSGGLGYRNKGKFIDLTYVHNFINFSDVPYWLADFPNPVADGKNNRGQIILTVGFKFI
jgi:hypothetical protein